MSSETTLPSHREDSIAYASLFLSRVYFEAERLYDTRRVDTAYYRQFMAVYCLYDELHYAMTNVLRLLNNNTEDVDFEDCPGYFTPFLGYHYSTPVEDYMSYRTTRDARVMAEYRKSFLLRQQLVNINNAACFVVDSLQMGMLELLESGIEFGVPFFGPRESEYDPLFWGEALAVYVADRSVIDAFYARHPASTLEFTSLDPKHPDLLTIRRRRATTVSPILTE